MDRLTIAEALELAIGHHSTGQLEEAADIYRQILAVAPDQARAWHLLGLVARQWNELDLAVQYMGRALELEPGYGEAHCNLGDAWQQTGDLARGEESFRRAIELRPTLVEAHYNLGNLLMQAGKPFEATESYRRALQLAPDFANAHNNLGNALYEQGQYEEAGFCFRRAVELAPQHAEAHGNLSHLLLLTGDFEAGWREYLWRWKSQNLEPPRFNRPLWDGGSLAEKTILLHAEQGLGDTIQFVRYATLVKSFGAEVLLECPPVLKQLLACCAGIDQLIEVGHGLPPFDVQAPLLSVPGILKTSLDTIPATIPYLQADHELVAKWRAALADVQGFRIGINWTSDAAAASIQSRNLRLEYFESLANLPGVRLINLQQGKGRSELARPRNKLPIVDLGESIDREHGAFMDTAAVMKNLDLVITSDTSIPHLAGALGVPVWVALPFVPDWRWQAERSDCPWYPTMRLFRQKTPGDWQGVIAEIEAALQKHLRQLSFST